MQNTPSTLRRALAGALLAGVAAMLPAGVGQATVAAATTSSRGTGSSPSPHAAVSPSPPSASSPSPSPAPVASPTQLPPSPTPGPSAPTTSPRSASPSPFSRRSALSVAGQQGGLTLDGWGGLHGFGGFQFDAGGAAYWPGWDIARAVAVRADGSGGWVLDGWGGIHNFGSAAPIATPGYWQGFDIARAVVVSSHDPSGLPDGRQGYLLDGWGGLHPWGGAPALTAAGYTPGNDVWRGLEIHEDASGTPDGGWELRSDGTVVAFGAAPPLPSAPLAPTPPGWQQLHAVGASVYAVPKFGVLAALSGPLRPNWVQYGDWGGWDILRDIVVVDPTGGSTGAQPVSAAAMSGYRDAARPRGGVTLDGYGGLHAFGGMPLDARGGAYWPGWDIARSLQVRADGRGGWTLDGWGGIHAFGQASPVATPAYWQGYDIARSLVMTSRDANGVIDGRQGYLLDGYGGIHPFGGAPALPPGPYWAGFDIARGLDIHLDPGGTPDGGSIVDAWGGVHPFGAYPALATFPDYWPGRAIYRQLRSDGSAVYAVTSWGIASGLSPSVAPHWAGYGDWGAWGIVRDVALFGTANPTPTAQPTSGAAGAAQTAAIEQFSFWAPLIRQEYSLDCESAALRIALAARGTNVSEDWILGQMGADLRRPILDSARRIIRWGNPFSTFVGDVRGSEPNDTGYGVYFGPIASVAQRTGHLAIGGQGWAAADIFWQLAQGHPVVIWTDASFVKVGTRTWTAWDGQVIPYEIGEHAATLVGVDVPNGTVTLVDPDYGTLRTFSINTFLWFWSTFSNMAVVVN